MNNESGESDLSRAYRTLAIIIVVLVVTFLISAGLAILFGESGMTAEASISGGIAILSSLGVIGGILLYGQT